MVPIGNPITWTYVVTNTGDTPLTGVAVTDDQGVTVTCPQANLAPNESMTCTAPAATAEPGQYENVGTARATSPTQIVRDSDASHYFGEDASIDIEKSTNGADADNAPGPFVTVGDRVTWTMTSRTPATSRSAGRPTMIRSAPWPAPHWAYLPRADFDLPREP